MFKNIAKSPWPGCVVMVLGLILNAVANGWYLFAVGAIWTIGAMFHENFGLKERLKPKLRFVFDQDKGSPFVRDKPMYQQNVQVGTLRIFSVGVANDGAETSAHAAVRLMKIEPAELEPYWNSTLHVANEEKSSSHRDIHHSSDPVAFFEVVSQLFNGNTPTTSLRVRFSGDLFERQLTLRDRYTLTLATDGAGAASARRYVIQRNKKSQYEMRSAWPP